MIKLSLVPHPDTPPRAVDRVRVRLSPSGHRPTVLEYRVFATGDLALPAIASAERRDGLWQTSCFEMFVQRDDEDNYEEFNFSPSRCWSAYSFARYREGMRELPLMPPKIAGWGDVSGYTMRVELDLITTWASVSHIGLAAVVEEADGTKSYWALAHLPGRPDFHHSNCFTLKLPPLL